MAQPELANRIRQLSDQHKHYGELFLRFALVAGALSHELKELGVAEVRTHGHIRFTFLAHEVLIDYRPCMSEDRLLGKLRFSQKEAAEDVPATEFYALYFDETQRVSSSPSMTDPQWRLLDESQAREFISVALMRLASAELLPA